MENLIALIAKNDILFVFGIIFFFSSIEGILGYLSHSKRSKDDVLVEIVNIAVLSGFTKPLCTLFTYFLLNQLIPDAKGAWAGFAFWLSLMVFLLVDDVSQYWFHRLAHEHKWLWKWHRPHHAATEMGFLVSYREAIWYFMLIPNVYWLGIFIFLGGGVAAGFGVVLKQLIIISSHSLAAWDKPFYRNKYLLPIIKVIERIFITPAFHHGHHAVSKVDGIGNPNGNFGNMFSIWDQLFGTAHFAHAFPTDYGIPNDPKDTWTEHLFYPLVTSDNLKSELSKDFTFEKTTQLEPATLVLEAGNYLYCTCGYSKTQPFCDGSHHGTKFQPELFTIKKEMAYKLCQCKGCKKAPFCDDSHLKLKLRDES
jgi:sterol desaturase/sphingolipid hydroxylase (fatty acid hydroxylase superfamily)/CDGSH-type Zn-finger protein